MKPWGNLGVTIYGEEGYDENCSRTSPSDHLSPSVLSSPATPLHSRVEAWSSTMGRKSDVLIYVQGTAFHLHKDPVSTKSIYLRRRLTEQSELTLSPTLNITAETFALVADFCYRTHLLVTPFNVASLLLAAELLEMIETKGNGDQNLKQITESYFRRFVAVNSEYATIVFRSCLALLPEAETTAFLISKCMEVMNLMEDCDGVDGYIDDIISLRTEDFKILVESMHQRFMYHDLVYRIVDFYLEEHNGKITEEQKTQICNSIDCNKLSPHRFSGPEERAILFGSSSENSCIDSPKIKKTIGQRLIKGLKSALRVSNSTTKNGSDHKKSSSKSEISKVRSSGENGIL